MSSDFYQSTHAKYWLLTRDELEQARAVDLKYATPHQLYCLNIFFASLIQKLGKRLLLRQVPIATATVYFRRFYTKNSICETNPYLVLAACVFVAAKVEETPVHIKSVVAEAKVVFTGMPQGKTQLTTEHNIKMFPAEPHKLGEMEFYLMEDIDFHLVIFHPYRALLSITGREPSDTGRFPKSRVDEDMDVQRAEAEERKKRGVGTAKGPGAAAAAAAADEFEGEGEAQRMRRLMGRGSGEGLMEIDEGTLQIAWFTLNDSYRSDVPLLYPPYIIALAALYIAFTLTTMSSSATRTRASSSQMNTLAASIETNQALALPAPPNGPAEFLASFQVSLPTLFACVQDMICLYHVWEIFEPAPPRSSASTQPVPPPPNPDGRKFGPDDAEALVRKMIEEHMVDMGHPDDAGRPTKPLPSK